MERRSGDAHGTKAGRTVAPSALRRRPRVMWDTSCPRPLLLSSLFASSTKNSGWKRAKDCSHLRASNMWVEGISHVTDRLPAYFFFRVPYVYTSWTSLRRAAAVVTPPSLCIRWRVLLPNGGRSCRPATELGNGEESSNCCQSECSRLFDSRTRIETGDSLVVDILPSLVVPLFGSFFFLCVMLSSLESLLCDLVTL